MDEYVTVLTVRKPNGETHATYASVDSPTIPELLREVLRGRGVSDDLMEIAHHDLDSDAHAFLNAAAELLDAVDLKRLHEAEMVKHVRTRIDELLPEIGDDPNADLDQDVIHRAMSLMRNAKRLAKEGVDGADKQAQRLRDALGLGEPEAEAEAA